MGRLRGGSLLSSWQFYCMLLFSVLLSESGIAHYAPVYCMLRGQQSGFGQRALKVCALSSFCIGRSSMLWLLLVHFHAKHAFLHKLIISVGDRRLGAII